jgi:hypothetical protein
LETLGARFNGVRSVWFGAIVFGFLLRAIPLTAGKPYMAYIDEGNFLHSAIRLLRDGGWDPRTYLYPQFPTTVSVAAMRLYVPLYQVIHGTSLRDRIPAHIELYDELEPFDLLFIGRSLCMALSLFTVILTGLFARRLGGPVAGAAAALLAAVAPTLVLRGSIATVDPYATILVLGCLYATDVSRTSSRPGAVSLLAGLCAGGAFASKYPAVLVITAFGVTTLVQPLRWRQKLGRLGLALLGVLLGAMLAMPALLSHAGDVYAAVRKQASSYSQMTSPSLFGQAFGRAEWDIHYAGPELGPFLVLLAVGGLILGLRDRKLAPALFGWVAFAVASLVLYSRQTFQPFRNILPLVPIACIAASLLFTRIRSRLSRPWLADGVALAWIAAVFIVPLAGYALERHGLRDPRVTAIDWLVAHTDAQDEVLFIRELGFLNQELERLPARRTVAWWNQAEAAIREQQPRFFVVGVLERPGAPVIDVAALPEISAQYAPRLRVGERPTAGVNEYWRDNYETIVILERRNRLSRVSAERLPGARLGGGDGGGSRANRGLGLRGRGLSATEQKGSVLLTTSERSPCCGVGVQVGDGRT